MKNSLRGTRMEYIYGTADVSQSEESVVVLGNFDGVHRGHQMLIQVAKEQGKMKHLKTIVFSFYPHPSWVIGNHPKPLIMSRRDKKQIIKSLGLDILIEYPFTKAFANISPEVFFEEILIRQLKAKVLVVGENYYFGKNKAGNPTFLKELGQKHQVEVYVVPAVKYDAQMISSSTIRNLIIDGNIELANEMLGHPYTIVGNVVQGKQLGRTIGFPTINLIADPDRVYPPNGVYATKVTVYNKEYLGMTNIGYNPTVNGAKKMIETHIFNFDKDIYGQTVEVRFYDAIRPEQKFPSVDALSQQIAKDRIAVKSIFNS